MKWTEAQQQTIDTRDKNILVSAAAGSGKTAVLIERIKQLMLQDKVDIDRFLITTFTNAASAEMKERLEKAIKEELKKPESDKNFLKKQLMLLPNANISTFHTFALEVMRKFFYLIDLEPGFKIGDEIEVSIMKREAADELFEVRFAEDYEAFTTFLKKHSSDRNERAIKESIISLYDQLRSIPDYLEWAGQKAQLLAAESPSKALKLENFINEECLAAFRKAVNYFERAAMILEFAGLEKLHIKAEEDLNMLKSWEEDLETDGIGRFSEYYYNVKFNQMRATKEEKEDYEAVKESVSYCRKKGKQQLDNIHKKYLQREFSEYDDELKQTSGDTSYMIGLIAELEKLFKVKKQERNMVDFDDVMHYAIEILRDDMAAAEYRNKFKYIFIDEFQDSNMLQETIAARICRSNNLFMVGDVKQSIYKFRLAEPEIFKAKYALYASPEEKESIKIDLNSNFRSKQQVTELVNKVFHKIMDGYDENAELKCTMPDEYPGIRPQMNLIFKPDADEDMMDNSEMEVQYVVQLVKENLGTEIYDAKQGVYRKAGYRDIAVLARNKAIIGEIERALNNSGIPAYGETTGGYFDTVEVQVFINLLKVIDNFMQDVPLISIMRCPIFGFDVKELAAIRIFEREGSYHEAVKIYAEEGPDEDLRIKINGLLEQIAYWKELKTTVSLEELVRVLLYDTGYYDYCSGLPVGKQRISNLQLLAEKAAAFERSNYSGLYGFLTYLEAMRNSSSSMAEAKIIGDGEDLVQVMTVHKSKGLEFPIVILAGAGKQIRAKGSGTSASFHKDIAVGLPLINKEEKWYKKTLLQKIIDGRKAGEEFEEEIRILYVALTRAMDRIVITGIIKDPEALDDDIADPKTYAEMIYEPLREFGGEIKIWSGFEKWTDERKLKKDSPRIRLAELFERSRGLEGGISEEIDRVLSFEYPYPELDKVKSKYSVTELNKLMAESAYSGRAEQADDTSDSEEHSDRSDIILAKPNFTAVKKVLNAAEIGTVMHLVMEKLDFSRALEEGAPYIEEKVTGLLEAGDLSEEERAVIDIENAAAFFGEEVGKRAARALRLEKEREFILQKEISGAKAIVQGIIDCYFEEEDGLVLVDYKNSFMGDRVSEDTIVDRYKGQIELYKEALEAAEGKPVKEAYLYLFELKKFVAVK
ncbi:MAG: helicase-exonuclease AddAB subunit AddA [Firmicutes bacterium]|nr:helicase-exonuclease AddAB subunit AddA [Bacillota bacterium]